MNLLDALVQNPLAEALGWTLLHSLWQGAVIAAALAAALVALRSPRTRYTAACVAMLAMAAGFGLTLVHMAKLGEYGLGRGDRVVLIGWNLAHGTGASAPAASGLAALVPWLAPLWLAGVWIFALRYAAGWVSVSRLRRRGVCIVPERWQRELARLKARLDVSRPVLLLESCLAEAPMVLGHMRPAILMPVGLLTGLPQGQIEAILLHELAHVRRCDYLVNVLQRAAECLFFYHPAAWWMSRVVRNERESCCDDVAVELGGDVHEYALALAALEQWRGAGQEPAVAAKGGNLVKRIRRLLYPQRPSGTWTPLVAGAILVATAATALAMWPQTQPRQVRTGRETMVIEKSPYTRWLDGPVSYIITPRERAAFLSLTTDEERDMFIKQFWARRNPSPGSKPNTFRQEFYRRIGFADVHFAASRPGWKTDRGHIYIDYGPPDEINFFPNGTPYPHSKWTYYHLKGVGNNVVFRFVDRKGTGDFKLVPGRFGKKQ